MPPWVAMGLRALGIAGILFGIARGMRSKREDVSEANRAGLQDFDVIGPWRHGKGP